MILVDANLLIYAVNKDLPQHKQARAWWEGALSGAGDVGLPWVSLMAFLRICTNPRIFDSPLSPEQATSFIDEWLDRPNVRTVAPGPTHWAILKSLIRQAGTAGNLTTDAHIAALALEHGYTICSADNDFKRFPGVTHINPLADTGR
ncbi:MAG: type II toxin-antitoxin system VapC family toxin [Sulfuritalea sp.]|nr:type II toxin-antitoxin system VapC family toxin [Sulfuritalea sp.]MDP1985194.1 type II toxin-antitoxin system VapC family toxin [Sulfuritalea sp.]